MKVVKEKKHSLRREIYWKRPKLFATLKCSYEIFDDFLTSQIHLMYNLPLQMLHWVHPLHPSAKEQLRTVKRSSVE